MVRNQEKYDQVISLRKKGFTLSEIAKICEVSKSTASIWLKNKPFSDRVSILNQKRAGQENAKRLNLVAKTRASERKLRSKDVENSAKVEFTHYQKDPLFLAGLTAYLAAGDLNNKRVIRLSHGSVEVHKLFIQFASKYLGVDRKKIHLWLLLYGNTSEERAMKHWSKKTTVPYDQFYKNQYVNKTTKKTLHKGVGNTIIGSTYHKQKLKIWIKLVSKLW